MDSAMSCVPKGSMEKSPSVIRGMSAEEEVERKLRGIRFLKYMMMYLTSAVKFEEIIKGPSLRQTKTPRVFPTAVHKYLLFFTMHPLQIFNEYSTAAACLFHAGKIEELIIPLPLIVDVAHITADQVSWVRIPEDLSFSKPNWAEIWMEDVITTEGLIFTSVNRKPLLFENVHGFIFQYLWKWVDVAVPEQEAIRIRDRAFEIASELYDRGSPLIVTEPTRRIAAMCLQMTLDELKISITNWKAKTEDQRYWYNAGAGELSTDLSTLKNMELENAAHLRQYQKVKLRDDGDNGEVDR